MRVAALVAAALAATHAPGAPLGVGATAVGVLVVAAALRGASRRSRSTWVFGGFALALVASATFRDDTGLVAVDLAAAFVLLSFAVGGTRLVAPILPFAALGHVPATMPDLPRHAPSAFRGMLVGSAVLLPFVVLFWTGDAAFAALAEAIPLPEGSGLPVRVFVFVAVLALALGLALAGHARVAAVPVRVPRRLAATEWAIALGLLNLLFVSFVAVQVAVLFAGRDHVLRTAGLTYAEYARSGYWQLLGVVVLTLGVVLVAPAIAETRSMGQRLLLRCLLALLTAMSLVVLASGLYRLDLYEAAYGLTRLRLAAEDGAMLLGALLVLCLTGGLAAPLRSRLPGFAVGLVACGLLGFTLSNPDGRVAGRNVERWRDTGRIDIAYLRGLSADASPRLAALPAPLRQEALEPLRDRVYDGGVLSWNVSRARAEDLVTPP